MADEATAPAECGSSTSGYSRLQVLIAVAIAMLLTLLLSSRCSIEQFTKLLATILTWPVVTLALVLVFRSELATLLERVQEASISGSGLKLVLAESTAFVGKVYFDTLNLKAVLPGEQRPVQAAEGLPFTDDDLVVEFGKVAGLEGNEGTATYKSDLAAMLRRNGIKTKKQLSLFVARRDIQDTIRCLYREELKRSPEQALDPVALAAWGAPLYAAGVTPDVVRKIRHAIRRSPEYAAMH